MKQLLIYILLLWFVVPGCKNAKDSDYATSEVAVAADMAESEENRQAKNASPPSNAPTPAPPLQAVERKIIRNGDIRFETADLVKTRTLILKTTSELGGYVGEESQSKLNDRIENHIVVRVPATRFEELLDKVSQAATLMDSRNIRSQDVTEEFIDVEARLKTKKELETRYLELLKQAKKIDDILQIEGQLANVRSEIEAMEGRLNFLKNQVGYSTLSITYYETRSSPIGFGSKIGDAFANGWRNLSWFFIMLANIWPFILIGGVIIFLVFRKKRT